MEEPLKRPSFSDLRPAPITTRRIETPVFSIKCDAQTGSSSNGGGGDYATQEWVLEQLRALGIEAACEDGSVTVTLTGKPS
jgi:hypothetical protein